MPVSRRRRAKRPTRRTSIPLSVWLEAAGVLLIGAGVVSGLSMLSPSQSVLTGTWLRLLRLSVGWGAVLLPVASAGAGYLLFLVGLGRPVSVSLGTAPGVVSLYLAGLGLAHFFASDPQGMALAGRGGGQVGWWISSRLSAAVGRPGAAVALLVCVLVGGMAVFGVSARRATASMFSLLERAVGGIHRQSQALLQSYRGTARESLPERLMGKLSAKGGAKSWPEPSETQMQQAEEGAPLSRSDLGPTMIPDPGSDTSPADVPAWRLPSPIDVLEQSSDQELSEAEIRSKVRIIEEALANLGVPGSVVEVNQGPTVTQFGVEPGFLERRSGSGKVRRVKVKVNRISALANDLALALAASPIRIEAPVPGRSMVGIEVPNVDISVVRLSSVIESEAFQSLDGPLRIALGQDVAGRPVAADLGQMPHLLIAGATGSGKSVCINAIVCCLLLHNTPADLRLIMVDPKMVELTGYNGIPHLLAPVIVDLERVVVTLKWVTGEMERRYKLFSSAAARNIEIYNQMLSAKGAPKLPYIGVIIDELADLMMLAADEVERHICRIAQLARATGIHLVIATQRPSVDVVTGLIKANFPARITFMVTSQVDSRVVVDTSGAEKLLGRGDMLYMASDSSKLLRLQGCFVSDSEIERLVSYWRSCGGVASLPPGAELVQRPLWSEMQAREQQAAAVDELLEEAVQLVREHSRASVSLLQRRLRIGYLRACRLIDAMEEMGVVGPEPGRGRGREVFPAPEETDAGQSP